MSQDIPQSQSQSQRDTRNGVVPKQLHDDLHGASYILPLDLAILSKFDTPLYGAATHSYLPPVPDVFTRPSVNFATQHRNTLLPYSTQSPGRISPAMTPTKALVNDSNMEPLQPNMEGNFTKEHSPLLHKQVLWPNYPPGFFAQSEPRHSRLPSNDVARKAPRKATTSSPAHDASLRTSSVTSKANQRRKDKQEYRRRIDSALPIDYEQMVQSGTPGLAKSVAAVGRSTPLRSLSSPEDLPSLKTQKGHLLSSARSRPVILEDGDEVSSEEGDGEDDDDDLPLRTLFAKKHPRTPIRRQETAEQVKHADRPRVTQVHSRRQPRYDYLVPDELGEVHRALGDDNWTDYIMLMEKKLLGEMTEVEFVVQSKTIFMVFDSRTRIKLEKRIANTVVLPVIEQHKEHDAGLVDGACT